MVHGIAACVRVSDFLGRNQGRGELTTPALILTEQRQVFSKG